MALASALAHPEAVQSSARPGHLPRSILEGSDGAFAWSNYFGKSAIRGASMVEIAARAVTTALDRGAARPPGEAIVACCMQRGSIRSTDRHRRPAKSLVMPWAGPESPPTFFAVS